MTAKFYGHFVDVPASEWRWKNFTPREMADSRDHSLLLVPAFMDWLQVVRNIYRRPMVVTSGFRTPEHQQTLPGFRTTGSHVHGMAVDIKIYGPYALDLIGVACAQGVMGVGIHQEGDILSRYVHLDMWNKGPEGVRPNIWSY